MSLYHDTQRNSKFASLFGKQHCHPWIITITHCQHHSPSIHHLRNSRCVEKCCCSMEINYQSFSLLIDWPDPCVVCVISCVRLANKSNQFTRTFFTPAIRMMTIRFILFQPPTHYSSLTVPAYDFCPKSLIPSNSTDVAGHFLSVLSVPYTLL